VLLYEDCDEYGTRRGLRFFSNIGGVFTPLTKYNAHNMYKLNAELYESDPQVDTPSAVMLTIREVHNERLATVLLVA